MVWYTEPLTGGIFALVYTTAMLGVAIWMAIAAPRSPTTNAMMLFAGCSILLWGIYGFLYTVVAAFDYSGIRPQLYGVQGMFRVSLWLILAAWIHLALTITPGRLRPLQVGVVVAAGAVLGTLNYLNMNHSPWDFYTGLVIQSIPVVVVAVWILIYVLRTRHSTQPGTLERRRSNAYLIAFIAHDVVMLGFFTALGLAFALLPTTEMLQFEVVVAIISFTILTLVFLPSLVYSVATGRILDFERRAHLTLSNGAVAGIIIGVFVAVQTFVSEFFTTTAGLAGGAAASGLLFLALSPLQRMAERVADRTVPQGRASAKLSSQEREFFYREQVEIAYSDGVIGAKERETLRSVRQRLGMDAETALGIEEMIALEAASSTTTGR